MNFIKRLIVKWGGCSLQRMVRRLVELLLGECNAKNIYGEDDATKQFEAHAKRIGATVVALDPAPGYQRYPDGVIDPLSYSEKEQGEEKQNQVALRNGLRLDGKARDHTSAANDCEGVPPVIYLQPGERITHVMAKWPNDPSSATRPAGRHDCNSDAMAGFAAAHG